MITIENRKTEIVEAPGQPETLRYSDIMKMIVDKPSLEGFTLTDMRRAFRMIDVLDAASKENKESFELEEDDYKLFLKQYPENFRWLILNRSIIEFDDYIRSLNKPKTE